MKTFLQKHYHRVIFAIFMLIHALTCVFTDYFGDDYYYAAFVKNGFGYFIKENIFHYRFTNGRALVHLLDELLIGWSFWLWRIFNVIVIALLVIVIAKLASRSYREDRKERYRDYQLALSVTCCVIGITSVAILRQSVYWATGSLNYLVPATAALWFYYYFRRDFERFRGSWLLLPAAFFASATTEQASAAALLVTLCFIVSSFAVKKKKPRPAYLGAFISSLAGFCTLYLSPGNSARTEFYPEFYSLGLFGKIGYNLPGLSSVIFSSDGLYSIFCVMYAVIIMICVTKYVQTDSVIKRVCAALFAVWNALTLVIYVYGITEDSEILKEPLTAVLVALPIFAAMAWTLVRYFRLGEIDGLYFVWCAFAMQAAMSLAPEYGPRTLLISLVLLAVPVVRVIVENRNAGLSVLLAAVALVLVPRYITSPQLFALILAVIAVGAALLISLFCHAESGGENCFGAAFKLASAFALAVCAAQFSTVAAGYYGNTPVIELNRKQVEDYCKTDKTGAIILYYLPNEEYKYTMPYDNPYHEQMFLILHGIDPDTKVWYEFLPQYFDIPE